MPHARNGRVADSVLERKKAIRKLRQIQRELSNQAETSKADKDRLLDAQVDVNYTLYYPLNRKYISLYKSCAGDPKSQTAKDSIKADIRKRTQKGTLGKKTTSAQADNGGDDDDGDVNDDGEALAEKSHLEAEQGTESSASSDKASKDDHKQDGANGSKKEQKKKKKEHADKDKKKDKSKKKSTEKSSKSTKKAKKDEEGTAASGGFFTN